MKDIIRFKKDGGRQILILYGITKSQAREWCESEYTRKEGKYFDGFVESGTYCVKQMPKYNKFFIPDIDNN